MNSPCKGSAAALARLLTAEYFRLNFYIPDPPQHTTYLHTNRFYTDQVHGNLMSRRLSIVMELFSLVRFCPMQMWASQLLAP